MVHLPEKYGNWRGVYNRLRMWAVDRTWERVFTVDHTPLQPTMNVLEIGRAPGLSVPDLV